MKEGNYVRNLRRSVLSDAEEGTAAHALAEIVLMHRLALGAF